MVDGIYIYICIVVYIVLMCWNGQQCMFSGDYYVLVEWQFVLVWYGNVVQFFIDGCFVMYVMVEVI